MKRHHKLSKSQFDRIREDLLTTTVTQADIAKKHYVSTSMVSLVNNNRTWGNYLADKKAKHPLRSKVQPVSASVKPAKAPISSGVTKTPSLSPTATYTKTKDSVVTHGDLEKVKRASLNDVVVLTDSLREVKGRVYKLSNLIDAKDLAFQGLVVAVVFVYILAGAALVLAIFK